MKSCPSRSATTGTNSWPGVTDRESIEAPSMRVAGPTARPPTALATSSLVNCTALTLPAPPHAPGTRAGTFRGRERARPYNRAVTEPTDLAVPLPPKVRLVVLFGGQSAEHEVSCVTAAHVLRAADPGRYELAPIGITREGTWLQSDDALAALDAGSALLPARLEASGVEVDPLPAVRRWAPTTCPSWCCRCCTARTARTAPCRASSRSPTSPSWAAGCSARRCAWTRPWPRRWRRRPASPSARRSASPRRRAPRPSSPPRPRPSWPSGPSTSPCS